MTHGVLKLLAIVVLDNLVVMCHRVASDYGSHYPSNLRSGGWEKFTNSSSSSSPIIFSLNAKNAYTKSKPSEFVQNNDFPAAVIDSLTSLTANSHSHHSNRQEPNKSLKKVKARKATATLQMKKIGLEIPESTRKDMVQMFQNSQDPTKPRPLKGSRRRILIDCGSGSYDNNGTCSSCSSLASGCANCTSGGCSGCEPRYFFSEGSCRACGDYCGECNDVNCTLCDSSFSLQSNSLDCVCSSGNYISGGDCVSCPTGCTSCSGPSSCSSCAFGYFHTGSTCVECGPNCKECTTTTQCTLCVNDYYPLEVDSTHTTCTHCAEGQCGTGATCAPAATPCSRCSIVITNCTACVDTHTYIKSTHDCYKNCPRNEYLEMSSRNCLSCPTGCKRCIESSPGVSCIECDSLYVLASNNFTCQPYEEPKEFKFRLPDGLLQAPSVLPLINVRYTRNVGYFDGDTLGQYTVSPTTLNYIPCGPPKGTCVRLSAVATPLTCALNAGLFNNSCVAKFASGFVNSTSMQVVASPDPKVLFYDSNNALDCAAGNVMSAPNTCSTMLCQTPKIASGKDCIANLGMTGCIVASVPAFTCAQCDDYYYLNPSNTCSQSLINCLITTTATGCDICAPGSQLRSDGICSPVCPDGFTFATNTLTCEPGSGVCKTYQRDNKCTSCLDGYYLSSTYDCVKSCREGFYLAIGTQICEACPTRCVACTSKTACTVCLRGSTLSSGVCSPPPTCATGCQNCTGSSPKDCFAALPGYYLNYSNEVVKYTPYCDYGKYYDSTTSSCKACHSVCYLCSGPGPGDCLACSTGHMRYGSVCFNPANVTCAIFNGKYLNVKQGMTCENCNDPNCRYCPDQQCEDCSAGYWVSSGVCTPCLPRNTVSYCSQVSGARVSCKVGYKLLDNTCTKICRPGYYRTTLTATDCTRCPNASATCMDITGVYTSCPPGDTLYKTGTFTWDCTNNQDVSFNGYYDSSVRCDYPNLKCSSASVALACYDSYYLNGTICSQCADRCLTCSGAASNCTSCHMGYTYDGALGTCTAVCERYEYLDTASLECIPCSRNCRTCDGTADNPDRCTACFDGFYLDINRCLPCYQACTVCSGPAENQCSLCLPGFTLQGSSCVMAITPNTGVYYDGSVGKVLLCHKFCLDCVGPTNYNCTSCPQDYVFIKNTFATDQPAAITGSCKRSCPVGLGVQYELPNDCRPCHATCATCYGLGPDACVTCPTGRLLIGSRCSACHPSCLTCDGLGPTNCTSCQSSYEKDPVSKYCVGDCSGSSMHFNPMKQLCEYCSPTCRLCFDTTSTGCVTCAPATPNLLVTGECILECSNPGQVYIPIKRACLPCHTDCMSCFELKETDCKKCAQSGYLIQNGTNYLCKSACDRFLFQFNATHCLQCFETCETCNSIANTSCITCRDGFFLQLDNSCKSTCPENYYPDPIKKKCFKCAVNCKHCSRASDQYKCTECYDPRYLRSDNLCAKPCNPGLYFYDVADDCYTCHQTCLTCTAGSSSDCIMCIDGLLLSYTGECVVTCPSNSAKIGTTCKQCHRSCLTCSNVTTFDCLTCQASLLLTASGQCNSQCDPHEVVLQGQKCEKCHPSCDTCQNTSSVGCLSCINSTVNILSERGDCVNCLRSPEVDPVTCWFSVPLSLAEPSSRSLSLKASTSVKLTFSKQSTFMPRLTINLLSQILKVEVERLQPTEWTYKLRFEGGDILIDLYFVESKSWRSKLVVSPLEQIVLKNNKSGVAELIFWNTTTEFDIPVRMAPDAAIISVLESADQAQGVVSSISGSSTAIMTVFMMFATSSTGGILLKLVQVFKQLSRLRLLNVFFGSYLEMVLRVVANLYPLGGDQIVYESVRANPASRGKLDMYRVSVISADIMAWKYAVYFLLMGVRIYRTKVRGYATRARLLSAFDQLMDTLGEKCRTLIIAIVGIDIAFYSLRCLSHMDLHTSKEFISNTSFVLSLFTINVMTADLIQLFIENKHTTFSKFRAIERVKRVVLKRHAKTSIEPPKTADKITAKQEKESLTAVKITILRGARSSKRQKSIENDKKKQTKDQKIDRVLSEYLYGYRQQKRVIDNPSAEQFFGNGIKLHKLRTPEGRYYNTVAMIKLFLLEPIFIDMQLFPSLQMLTITLLQTVYFLWIIRVALKESVFESRIFGISTVCNEFAILVFMLTGSTLALSGGVGNISDHASNGLQLMAIIFILLASLMGLVEFIARMIGTVVNVYKNKMLSKLLNDRQIAKEEQGLVRHRVIGRDLPGAEPPVPPVDADMSSSVADIKANQVGQSAKPVLGKTRLAPGKRLSRPPLQPLARK